jgi:hypothetical protein
MAVGDHDVEIAGTRYRLDRDAESPYQKSTAALRLSSQAATVGQVLHYREDLLDAHQTDYSGGSQWWQPRLNSDNPNGYLTSTLFDSWTEPGKLRPIQKLETDATPAEAWLTARQMSFALGRWWWIGSTGEVITYLLTGAGDTGEAFSPTVDTGSGDVLSTVASSTTGSTWLYLVSQTDQALKRVKLSDGTLESHVTGANWPPHAAGASLLNWQGRLLFWSGIGLYEIDETTTETVTLVGDDGFDEESALNDINAGDETTPFQAYAFTEAAVGDDGVYVVKTLPTPRGYQPVVFRFFTDGDTDVFEEVTRLPIGSICLSVMWHLGQLLVIIASSIDLGNQVGDQDPHTALYFVQNRQPGALYTFDPANSALYLLGSDGKYVFMASKSSLWLYDSGRGAVHKIADIGDISAMGHTDTELFFVQGQDGGTVSTQIYYQTRKTDPEDRVFDATQTASWFSNWIDFDSPNEQKTLARISLLTDALTAGATFVVRVRTETEAGSQTAILTASTDGDTFHQGLITDSTITGRRFQLEIEYTGDDAPLAVYSVSLEATGQEYVKVWDLVIDGQNAANVANEPVRTTDVDDALDTLVATAQPITFKDGYRSDEPDDNTSHTVRVESVQVTKRSQPDRMTARVRLAEVPA